MSARALPFRLSSSLHPGCGATTISGLPRAAATLPGMFPAGNRQRSRPSGEIGRHKGLEQFEPSGGNARSDARQIRRTPWMHGIRANAEPSPSAWLGRCREQTAGTYGREAMVKACSSPRTASALAAKAEAGRKSLAARRAGSIPASGTNPHLPPFAWRRHGPLVTAGGGQNYGNTKRGPSPPFFCLAPDRAGHAIT
ncbi:hypothetical protein CBM2617_A180017 [Cupriavidus taiwanensis]|nr:hypothetical protein CBM2591_A200016 [Cupriavidus taiwanensis]SOZ54826.1 hypothetical protein CBM2617_A180017 [Cupriavidus taiwanensis]